MTCTSESRIYSIPKIAISEQLLPPITLFPLGTISPNDVFVPKF